MRNLKRVLALALALVMMLGMMITASAASYSDADQIDANYAEAVDVLTGLGVFQGMGNNVFGAKTVLTRAQASALIYRVITADVNDKQVSLYAYPSFTDMATGAWYTGYVTYAANGGYIKGYGNGVFGPDDAVTGVQVLAIMLRAIGYGQNGEFEGAAWKDNVLTTANDLDLLKGITAKTLDDGATRELVAQLLFNCMTKANMVTYTPALGYLPVDLTNKEGVQVQTLGLKTFKLSKTAAGHGDWGRPYDYKWVINAGTKTEKTLYTAWEAPLATYTEETKNCDIYADTGLKKGTELDVYTNSNTADDDTYKIADKGTYGEQGRLTEVYSECVVNIDTYLAEVTKVVAEKTDSRTHVVTPASVNAAVYNKGNDTTTTLSFETDEFAVGDIVLVTILDGEIMTMETAEAAVATLTKVASNSKSINDIQKVAALDKADVTVNHTADMEPTMTTGKNYTFYYDQYDNVIGAAELKTNYVVLDSVYTTVSAGKDTSIGTVVFFNAEKDEDVTIARINGDDVFAPIKSYNEDLYYTVYAYTEKDGAYTLTNSGFNYADAGEYRAGSTYMMATEYGIDLLGGGDQDRQDENITLQLSKNSTILLQTSDSPDGTFKAYTGYADLPSFAAYAIQYTVDANGYVDMMYAYVREFTSRTVFVYDTKPAYTWTESGKTYAELPVLELVDGKMTDTTVKVECTSASAGAQVWAADIDEVGLYEITEGENGIWYAIEEYDAYKITPVTQDGIRVEINGKYAYLDNAKIVKYEGSWVSGKYDLKWTAKDLIADKYGYAYVQYDENGTIVAVYDMWVAVDVVFAENDGTGVYENAKIEAPTMYWYRAAKDFTVSVDKFVKVDSVKNGKFTETFTATTEKEHNEVRTYTVKASTEEGKNQVRGDIVVTLAADAAHTEAGIKAKEGATAQNLTVSVNEETKVITVTTTDIDSIKIRDVAALLEATGTHNKGMKFFNNTNASQELDDSAKFEIVNVYVMVYPEDTATPAVKYTFAAPVVEATDAEKIADAKELILNGYTYGTEEPTPEAIAAALETLLEGTDVTASDAGFAGGKIYVKLTAGSMTVDFNWAYAVIGSKDDGTATTPSTPDAGTEGGTTPSTPSAGTETPVTYTVTAKGVYVCKTESTTKSDWTGSTEGQDMTVNADDATIYVILTSGGTTVYDIFVDGAKVGEATQSATEIVFTAITISKTCTITIAEHTEG